MALNVGMHFALYDQHEGGRENEQPIGVMERKVPLITTGNVRMGTSGGSNAGGLGR